MNKKKMIISASMIALGIILLIVFFYKSDKVVLVAYDDTILDGSYVEKIWDALDSQDIMKSDYVEMSYDLYNDRINYAVQNKLASVVISPTYMTKYEMYLYAESYTDVTFITMDTYYEETLDNLVGISFDDYNIGYIAGVIAGLSTNSEKIGIISSSDSSLIEGFYFGALSSNSDATIYLVESDNYEEMLNNTENMFENSVDTIFDASMFYNSEIMTMISENEALVIGLDYGEETADSEYVLANLVKNLEDSLSLVLEDYKNGELENNYEFNFKEYTSINFNTTMQEETIEYIEELIENLD